MSKRGWGGVERSEGGAGGKEGGEIVRSRRVGGVRVRRKGSGEGEEEKEEKAV